jgi:hypothetical protein
LKLGHFPFSDELALHAQPGIVTAGWSVAHEIARRIFYQSAETWLGLLQSRLLMNPAG